MVVGYSRPKRESAFSIVELMVAVGIVSLLVTLAMPRYQAFIARGRMAEAKVNLGHIASLQGIYLGEWNKYGSLGGVGYVGSTKKCSSTDLENDLGFAPEGCSDLRYGYTSSGGTSFTATAKAGSGEEIYPDCTSKQDEWQVTSSGLKVKQTLNIIKHCE